MSSSPHEEHGGHPTFKQYVIVAIFLFIVTAIEFLIIVPDNLKGARSTMAPLIILSVIKFGVVIMFYMHLKFDARLFTGVFIAGLALGLAVTLAVVGLFGTFTPAPREFARANAVPYVHGAAPDHEPAAPPGSEAHPPATSPEGPGTPAEAPATDPVALAAQGKEIFNGKGICFTCHAIEGTSVGIVGPDLTHIGADAADRNPPQSAREYIFQSIREPEAFVPEGVERAAAGLMISAITSGLSDDEVTALTEFLLAQE